MTAPRVLFVLGGSTGGIGRHVLAVVRGVADAGIPVAVAGPAAVAEHFGFIRAGAVFHAVEISSSPRPAQDLRSVRALGDVLTSWKPTVVHAHGLRAGGVSVGALGKVRRRLEASLVVTWHNAPLGEGGLKRLQRAVEAIVARGADLTLCASDDLVVRAREFGARNARLAPVAAPTLAAPERGRDAVRAELGATDRPLLLAIGRLAPQKDYPTMLEAARLWSDLGAVLAIAGDGPLRDQMQAYIDHYELPVRLLGARDDIADLLAAADGVVLSSEWEARALVAQEALRAGVPLVTTAVGGVPGLVGEAAVLVPAKDPAALATGVRRVLTEPGLGATLAAAGVLQAATWPDEKAVNEMLINLYREWRVGAPPPIT